MRGFTPRQRLILALMATAVIAVFGLFGYVVIITTRQMEALSPLPSSQGPASPMESPTVIAEPSPTTGVASPDGRSDSHAGGSSLSDSERPAPSTKWPVSWPRCGTSSRPAASTRRRCWNIWMGVGGDPPGGR